MKLEIGAVVGRTSYNCDLLFRIVGFNEDKTVADLAGEEMRLLADAPVADLVTMSQQQQHERRQEGQAKEESSYKLFRQDYYLLRQKREYLSTNGYEYDQSYFELPGRVLHVDGDPLYLSKCLELYKRLGVPVYGIHIKETEMPEKVPALVDEVRPDILVITGHDAYMKSKGSIEDMQAYRHTKFFVRTVREIRRKYPQLDHLMIFAGACQSHFESLIKAGSNFASSPARINIHALDPVYIVSKISLTSFMDHVNVMDVLRNTLTGREGLGGVETKGFLRTGMPIKSQTYMQ
ncbi:MULTISPECIES: sporulation peptidase YabG [Fictibacillus]|uniref:Sporulation peptidase YabG n=1 Tax=Fictibacillus enclensis TaxID=1017270 RepID=A0A0V8IP85_9BACL|nr:MULTISPECIES: sporulation peptidase YabG [Fictibacillus]KSU76549.1 sporulation peptidase YabG [Fictibacillus enclensis]MDM5196823.1 sporulation peptidase YabG [Fictibacillus enclensis]RXZ01058.1 sporulation peptidase YabG [Fictibacillus sp. S7]WHY72448.1 sporulation peptidase YabG [Fictibacillus enclensis]SCC42418.1 spore coat assemly protein [Fictibacillus enclensis]